MADVTEDGLHDLLQTVIEKATETGKEEVLEEVHAALMGMLDVLGE